MRAWVLEPAHEHSVADLFANLPVLTPPLLLLLPVSLHADQQQAAGSGSGPYALDALDSSRTAVPTALLAAWRDEGAVQRLRNRFVTGGVKGGIGGSTALHTAVAATMRHRTLTLLLLLQVTGRRERRGRRRGRERTRARRAAAMTRCTGTLRI